MRVIWGLLMSIAVTVAEKFTNPVVWEDLPDNEVTRAGDTWYMTASSFHYSPGAPILRSYDLVNWDHIGRSVPVLDWSPKYSLEGGRRAYVKGIWASSLRYRESDGKFYYVTCIEFGKTYIYSAAGPTGPWAQTGKIDKCYYDAGLYFDKNDTPYVAYGRESIHVAQLSSNMKSEVREKTVLTPPNLILEGSRINGPFGPYDLRIIADNINLAATPISGAPHQGSLVETPKGDWYYMGFVDMYPGGRAPVLAPITWGSDGFPVIKLVNGAWGDYDCPLPRRNVQSVLGTYNFSGTALREDWEWNHNPLTSGFTVNNGLTLRTVTVTKDLYSARNTITHRIRGPNGTGTALLDVTGMKDRDRAGLGVLRDSSAFIGIEREGDNWNIVLVTDVSMNADWTTKSTGTVAERVNNVSFRKVYLRVTADIAPGAPGSATFS